MLVDDESRVDQAHGGAGADNIHGNGGIYLLHYGVGSYVLYEHNGLDTFFGGAGGNIFMFETGSALNDIDVVKEFSTADSDVTDLVDILGSAYDPLTDEITDFVEMIDNGSDTFLKVDRDGTGCTYSMTQIITLEGVIGLTGQTALESSGNLLAA